MEKVSLKPTESASAYVKYVLISHINPPKWDIRTERTSEHKFTEELKDDIRKNGLIEPIIVRPISDIRYEVVCGTFRVGACADLDYEKIPCRIIDLSDEEAIAMNLRENHLRKELTSYEKARVISRLRNIHNKKWGEIGNMTGLSISHCRKLHRVNQNLGEPLYTQWKKGIVSFRTAYNSLTENDGKDPRPKYDFLTGKRVNDYETIRVSETTYGNLELLKEEMEKIVKLHTKQELDKTLLSEKQSIRTLCEQAFGKYGVDFASALHGILIETLRNKT